MADIRKTAKVVLRVLALVGLQLMLLNPAQADQGGVADGVSQIARDAHESTPGFCT